MYSSIASTALPRFCILTFWVVAKSIRSDLNIHYIISVGLVDSARACGYRGIKIAVIYVGGLLRRRLIKFEVSEFELTAKLCRAEVVYVKLLPDTSANLSFEGRQAK